MKRIEFQGEVLGLFEQESTLKLRVVFILENFWPVVLNLYDKLSSRTKCWKKTLTLAIIYAASHTIPRGSLGYKKVANKFYGCGGSTLQKYSNEIQTFTSDIKKEYRIVFDVPKVACDLNLTLAKLGYKPTGEYYTYVLVDPRSLPSFEQAVFYVGKGKKSRIHQHRKDAKIQNQPKHQRINKLKELNLGYYAIPVFWHLSEDSSLCIEGLLIRGIASKHETLPYYKLKRRPNDDKCFLTNANQGSHFRAKQDIEAAVQEAVLNAAKKVFEDLVKTRELNKYHYI